MDPEEDNNGIPVVKLHRKTGERCKLKGPLRVVRLCLLAVLLPGLLVAVPLYLRYRVYSDQLVPLGMSDMRLLDNKISTTWCQSQLVSSNATFNAYLMARKPSVEREPKFVNMVREIVLEDDMKEYWGFYLLKGSTVTVSSCCRRPGASLIIIRGHHHLRHCAYIGDDSSEEQEEVDEIKAQREEEEKKYSIPKLMQRARSDVLFHGNETVPDGKPYLIKKHLDLHEHADEFDMSLLKEHRAITRPIGKPPTGSSVESFKGGLHSLASEEVFMAVIKKLKLYQSQGKETLAEVKKRLISGKHRDSWKFLKEMLEHDSVGKSDGVLAKVKENGDNLQEILKPLEALEKGKNSEHEGRQRRNIRLIQALRAQLSSEEEEEINDAQEEGEEHDEVRGSINGTTANDTSNSEYWSSFSSSEERLLECDGLILSQPLLPSARCHRRASPEDLHDVSSQQKISYTVPGNGYYFFVFSSENEIQPNYIRAQFELEKMQYNVSNPVAACENSTGQCSLPLNFFSYERVVLELPVNDSQWNTEYLVISTCEPRTALYVACIVAVPVLILLCAF